MNNEYTKNFLIKSVVVITPKRANAESKAKILEINKWMKESSEIKALLEVTHSLVIQRNANPKTLDATKDIVNTIHGIIFNHFSRKEPGYYFVTMVKRNICAFITEA